MLRWNLTATIAFTSGNWSNIELNKPDRFNFSSSGPVTMLALPDFCNLVAQLGFTPDRRFASKKVRMVVYRLTVELGSKTLVVSGGTMGINVMGDLKIGRHLFKDDDFTNSLPVVVEAGS